MNEPFTFDFFLSYAAADRAWVQGYLLPALGVPRERIITHDDFRLGAPRVSEIERAVTTSRYSILILSPAYLADEWASLSEQLAAHLTTAEQSVRLVPLLKFDCKLPLRIDFRVRLDCTDPANWERETARLRDLLNQPAPQPERIACPYPGMIPFRVEDARWFYGRAKEIEELVRRIRVQNFLFVIGPSGSGKSSLVFAGLVAELNKRQPDTWHIQTLRPGSDPLTALNDSTIALSNYRTNALLIIDQLEELFTQSDKPTQVAFIARLKSLRTEHRCSIVITMRADFYPDLMNSDLWPLDPSERVEIAPLRGAALAEAIGKPADKVGVYLEAGLVERLLADAADEPGVLPLVQETMVLLWDKRERRLLPLRAYEELGQDNLSGLAVAIATRADAVFAQLAESERKIARRVFLRLVQFGEGRADTRRQQRVSALRASGDEPNEFDRMLKHLTDHRLLTLTGEENDADRQVDIAHEALIAGWQRFRQWVNERREAEQTRRRLEDKAREWVRLGRGSAGLLDDVELREAENWLKSADATDLGYSETLPELIDISRAEIQRAEREVEEARQRELAQANALADEQKQRAETERKSRIRQRYFITGLVLLLIISSAIAVYAILQSRTSESRRLATQSAFNRKQKFDLALLLGVEALNLDNNYEVQANLLDSLTQSPRLISYLHGHTSSVFGVDFSPDGKTIASVDEDGSIILWDVNTHQPISQPIIGQQGWLERVTFSPDGGILAAFSENNAIVLWDANTLQQIDESIPGRQYVFLPDGTTLITVIDDTTIAFWDIGTHRIVNQIATGNQGLISSIALSLDGKMLAWASKDNTVILWNIATSEIIDQFPTGYQDRIGLLAFSPDSEILAMAGDAQDKIILYEINTHQPISQSLKSRVANMAFSRDGKILATNDDTDIILWDMNTLQPIGQPLTGHSSEVWSLVFSPDNNLLVSGGLDGTIALWNVSSRQIVGKKFEIPEKFDVMNVVFSPKDRILAFGGFNGVILWDMNKNQYDGYPQTFVSSLVFSPDGKTLASGGYEGKIFLWDVITHQVIDPPLNTHSKVVDVLAFNPDGKTLASTEGDNTITLWDTLTHQPIGQPLTGHKDRVSSMSFSPDGKTLVSGSHDNTIILWDVNTHQLISTPLWKRGGPILSVAFSPDGKMLASGDWEGTTLWDVSRRSPIDTLIWQSGDTIHQVAFSPNGKILAAKTSNGEIILWNLDRRRAMINQPLSGPIQIPFGRYALSFSPDDKLLATVEEDAIVIWELDEQVWRTNVCYIANRNLTRAEWALYIDPDPSTYRATCPGLPLEPVATPTPKP